MPESNCPICKKPANKQENHFFPFCSERCRMVDLGKWLDGKYVIPDKDSPEQKEEE